MAKGNKNKEEETPVEATEGTPQDEIQEETRQKVPYEETEVPVSDSGEPETEEVVEETLEETGGGNEEVPPDVTADADISEAETGEKVISPELAADPNYPYKRAKNRRPNPKRR